MQSLPQFLSVAFEELPRTSSGPDLTRYFFACGLIFVLILGLAYGFRRLFADGMRRRAEKRSLRVIDVLPLGGKQRLSVVRCYDRTFALGVGEKEVSLLAELDAVIGEESRTAAQSTPDAIDFSGLLENAKARLLAATRTATKAQPTPATAPPSESPARATPSSPPATSAPKAARARKTSESRSSEASASLPEELVG